MRCCCCDWSYLRRRSLRFRHTYRTCRPSLLLPPQRLCRSRNRQGFRQPNCVRDGFCLCLECSRVPSPHNYAHLLSRSILFIALPSSPKVFSLFNPFVLLGHRGLCGRGVRVEAVTMYHITSSCLLSLIYSQSMQKCFLCTSCV